MATSATPAPIIETNKKAQMGDEAARLVTLVFAGSILLITLLIVAVLADHSSLAFNKFGLSFFTSQNWDPNGDQFGALPFVYGTLMTSFLALLIAVPLGVGAAIFLAELAPPQLS